MEIIGLALSCIVGVVTYWKLWRLGMEPNVPFLYVPSYTEGVMMTTDSDVKGLA